jgi:acetoin utilization deacetylase AcuC-like enzyme
MSKLLLVRDSRFQEHLTPEAHPESPQRLVAIDKALHRSHLIKEVRQAEPRPATEDELSTVHKEGYIEHLREDAERAKKSSCLIPLDADTFMSPETYDTALLAAGAGLVAVDAIKKAHTDSSFVVVRPPGHHALSDKPMGFCLFNNVAVAARYAQKNLGFKRIFVIDWDVHHGNGTQDMFYKDPSVFFVSFHQFPFWPPDSGWYTQDGDGDGKGYNLNIPLPAGTGDRGYLRAWDELLKPICLEYKPDLIMLSAGYDAHQFDPLGQQQITTCGYGLLTQRLLELSQATNAKIVGFLEGGYNTKSLSEAVITTMGVLNQGPVATGIKK